MRLQGILILVALFFHCSSAGIADNAWNQSEVLFPEREAMRLRSVSFFKEVNLSHPFLEKVSFFCTSQAYPSAYLEMTRVVSRRFTDWVRLMDSVKEIQGIIPKVPDTGFEEKLNVDAGELRRLYLALMDEMMTGYLENRLSGERSYRGWNIVLSITHRAYTDEALALSDRAVILALSGRLGFFKRSNRWLKRSRKLARKLDPRDAKAFQALFD